MILRDNNPLDLAASRGEIITLDLAARDTTLQVAKSLDGQPLQAAGFAIVHPSVLTLALGFSGGGSGRYEVTIRGSCGGVCSRFVVHEPPGVPVSIVTYTFAVV